MPERALFPGVMILLLAAVALDSAAWRRRARRTPRALVVAFEMSRGFNSVFYPYLYDWLPFVRGLRVPARASILVGLTLALLAGVRCPPPAGGTVGVAAARRSLAVLVIAIAIDLRPLLRLEPVWLEPPPIYGLVSGSTDVVLAEFPFGGNPTRFTPNVPFMYFSLWHWAPMVNGYSGHYPPGQVDFEVALKGFPDATAIDSAANAGRDARDDQLRALPRRLRGARRRGRRVARLPCRDLGQMAGCVGPALRTPALTLAVCRSSHRSQWRFSTGFDARSRLIGRSRVL